MNSMVFIVCIVAIACTASVLNQYFKARPQKEEGGPDVDETSAQMEVLEERVRVLERIVTEKNFDLRREIDKL